MEWLKVLSLCLSCFALGFSLCGFIFTSINLMGKKRRPEDKRCKELLREVNDGIISRKRLRACDLLVKIKKKIKRALCSLFPRYKLRCILKALELEARPWQIDFALGRSNAMPEGRATGKTAAVMLRALMMNPKKVIDIEKIMMCDCDYRPDDLKRKQYYISQYRNMSIMCYLSGVPVPELIKKCGKERSWEVRR